MSRISFLNINFTTVFNTVEKKFSICKIQIKGCFEKNGGGGYPPPPPSEARSPFCVYRIYPNRFHVCVFIDIGTLKQSPLHMIITCLDFFISKVFFFKNVQVHV